VTAGEPLYRRDGDRYVPSGHTRGPWDPAAQHAGAPAALLAGAVEAVVPAGLDVVRLAYDVYRPVPMEPCAVAVEVTRPGRRLCGVRAELAVGDELALGVSAVAMRRDDTTAAATVAGPPPFPPPPGGDGPAVAWPFGRGHDEAFHLTGMDVRPVRGGLDRPGPVSAWFRLRRPVVGDEPVSPVQRVAAAADFANGLSWVVDPAEWLFVNVDLTVHLARPPDGEWVGVDALTTLGPSGAGWSEATVWDEGGRLGRCAQALYVARR
jgi:Thioesterase-like superfamily